jgi:hypothetical protein
VDDDARAVTCLRERLDGAEFFDDSSEHVYFAKYSGK